MPCKKPLKVKTMYFLQILYMRKNIFSYFLPSAPLLMYHQKFMALLGN